MVLLVRYHLWYVTAQSLSQNMIHAFVRQLIVLHRGGGMSLILGNYIIIISNDYGTDNVDEDSIVRQRL